MTVGTIPLTLSGCDVLPPMERPVIQAPTATPKKATEAKEEPNRRKTADRFGVVNAFLDFTAAGLSRAEALTWLVLWRDTKPDGTARTSQADLARRIGADRSTVKRAVAALVKAGLLAVVYRGSLRRGPSAYRVQPQPRDKVTPARSPPGR